MIRRWIWIVKGSESLFDATSIDWRRFLFHRRTCHLKRIFAGLEIFVVWYVDLFFLVRITWRFRTFVVKWFFGKIETLSKVWRSGCQKNSGRKFLRSLFDVTSIDRKWFLFGRDTCLLKQFFAALEIFVVWHVDLLLLVRIAWRFRTFVVKRLFSQIETLSRVWRSVCGRDRLKCSLVSKTSL
jgi:hypothetical protein